MISHKEIGWHTFRENGSKNHRSIITSMYSKLDLILRFFKGLAQPGHNHNQLKRWIGACWGRVWKILAITKLAVLQRILLMWSFWFVFSMMKNNFLIYVNFLKLRLETVHISKNRDVLQEWSIHNIFQWSAMLNKLCYQYCSFILCKDHTKQLQFQLEIQEQFTFCAFTQRIKMNWRAS